MNNPTPAERAAHVRHASIESTLVSAAVIMDPTWYDEIEAHIAHEIEQAIAVADQPTDEQIAAYMADDEAEDIDPWDNEVLE